MLSAPGRVVLGLLRCKAAVVPCSAFRVVAALAGVLATAVAAPPAGAQVGTVTEFRSFRAVIRRDHGGCGRQPVVHRPLAGHIGRITPAGT